MAAARACPCALARALHGAPSIRGTPGRRDGRTRLYRLALLTFVRGELLLQGRPREIRLFSAMRPLPWAWRRIIPWAALLWAAPLLVALSLACRRVPRLDVRSVHPRPCGRCGRCGLQPRPAAAQIYCRPLRRGGGEVEAEMTRRCRRAVLLQPVRLGPLPQLLPTQRQGRQERPWRRRGLRQRRQAGRDAQAVLPPHSHHLRVRRGGVAAARACSCALALALHGAPSIRGTPGRLSGWTQLCLLALLVLVRGELLLEGCPRKLCRPSPARRPLPCAWRRASCAALPCPALPWARRRAPWLDVCSVHPR